VNKVNVVAAKNAAVFFGSLSLFFGISMFILSITLGKAELSNFRIFFTFISSLVFMFLGAYLFSSLVEIKHKETDYCLARRNAKLELKKLVESVGKLDLENLYYDELKSFVVIIEATNTLIFGSVKILDNQVMPFSTWDIKYVHGSEILGLEIRENGKSILASAESLETSLMDEINGSLYGGADAYEHANTLKGKSKVCELSALLAIDNLKVPCIGYNFINTPVKKDSPEYLEKLESAKVWYGKISLLLHRQRANNTVNPAPRAKVFNWDDIDC
jgi:hypothetical protein